MPCACDPVEVHGWAFVSWIGEYFGECVYNPMDMIAFGLGLLNIGFWLVAQFPQLVENYRTKTVEALHPLFLAQWLLGDLTNLIGCIFTHQSPTQLYTAIYFCIMDVLLLSQFAWYTLLKRGPSGKELRSINEDQESLIPKTASTTKMFVIGAVAVVGLGSLGLGSLHAGSYAAGGRVLLELGGKAVHSCVKVVKLSHAEHIIGVVSAWTSGVLYFCARMPQIYLNFKRKSVEGLAFGMFFCAVMGNTCYGLSIILPGLTIDSAFWDGTFPYILGSLFVLSESSIIVVQFAMYKWWPAWKARQDRI